MLRLMQALFGHSSDTVCYPEDLLQAAIERVVDGTDSWLRAATGYRKKLRPAVLAAIQHCARLADALAPPIDLRQIPYDSDPRLRAFFISADHLTGTLRADRRLRAWHVDPGDDSVSALLTMEKREKGILGVDTVEGVVSNNVPLTTVSFTGHQLLDLAADEAQTRIHFQQRAFDHLIGLALTRLQMASGLRKELERRATLLQAKIDLLKRGEWGFNITGRSEERDLDTLQSELEDIDTMLSGVGGQTDYLDKDLELLVEQLGRAEEALHFEETTLIMDRNGIKRTAPTADAPAISLQAVRHSKGPVHYLALLTIPAALVDR